MNQPTPPRQRLTRAFGYLPISVAALLIASAVAWGVNGYRALRPFDRSGLPSEVRPVTIVKLSETEYDQQFQHLLHEEGSKIESCQRLALEYLGMVQKETVSEKGWAARVRRFLGGAVYPAFYRPGTDTIVVRNDSDPSTLRHEWVHAIHDQHADLSVLYWEAATTDQRIALRAVVEGTAEVFAYEAIPPTWAASQSFDLNVISFAYAFGPPFVRERAGNDPETAFGLRPRTSAEVMFAYPVRLASLPAAVLAPGERLLCTDRLGVLGIYSALRMDGMEDSEARSLLESWNGDLVSLIQRENGTHRVEWTVAFRNPYAAKAWRMGPGMSLPLTKGWVRMPILETH